MLNRILISRLLNPDIVFVFPDLIITNKSALMKIVVTGTRGIPNLQGGIETHCEELYPRLVSLNYDVVLIRRSCYIFSKEKTSEYKGVNLVTVFTLRKKAIETFIHTFLSVLWAKKHKADILHVHAIGSAIFIPFSKLLGLKVVFTHHGQDYNRSKWGPFAKAILRLGEKLGTRNADEVIVITEVIKELLEKKYKRYNTNLILNGFTPPVFTNKTDYIETLGLESRKYIFTLGRFVEEKGFYLLSRVFSGIEQKNYRLVIAGDADHETPYSVKLKKMALENNIVLTGFIKGDKLQQLFNNARLFVLPSYHEGLPISLLEAMSYKLPVLVSDIPANKQVSLPDHRYFITGDAESLKQSLIEMLDKEFELIDYDMSPYDWDKIARQTALVYEKVFDQDKKVK